MKGFGGSYRNVRLPKSKRVKSSSGAPTDPWPGIPTDVKLPGVVRKPLGAHGGTKYGRVPKNHRSHNYK